MAIICSTSLLVPYAAGAVGLYLELESIDRQNLI